MGYCFHQRKENDRESKAMTIFCHSNEWPLSLCRDVLIAHSSEASFGDFLGSTHGVLATLPQMLTLTKAVMLLKQRNGLFVLLYTVGMGSSSGFSGNPTVLRAAALGA